MIFRQILTEGREKPGISVTPGEKAWSPEPNIDKFFFFLLIPHLVPRHKHRLWRLLPRGYFWLWGADFFPRDSSNSLNFTIFIYAASIIVLFPDEALFCIFINKIISIKKIKKILESFPRSLVYGTTHRLRGATRQVIPVSPVAVQWSWC